MGRRYRSGPRGTLSIECIDFPMPFIVCGVEDSRLHLVLELDEAAAERFPSDASATVGSASRLTTSLGSEALGLPAGSRQ